MASENKLLLFLVRRGKTKLVLFMAMFLDGINDN